MVRANEKSICRRAVAGVRTKRSIIGKSVRECCHPDVGFGGMHAEDDGLVVRGDGEELQDDDSIRARRRENLWRLLRPGQRGIEQERRAGALQAAHNRASVGRPVRHLDFRARRRSQLLQLAAIRSDLPQFITARAVGEKDDALTVRRPAWGAVFGRVVGQLAQPRPIAPDPASVLFLLQRARATDSCCRRGRWRSTGTCLQATKPDFNPRRRPRSPKQPFRRLHQSSTNRAGRRDARSSRRCAALMATNLAARRRPPSSKSCASCRRACARNKPRIDLSACAEALGRSSTEIFHQDEFVVGFFQMGVNQTPTIFR